MRPGRMYAVWGSPEYFMKASRWCQYERYAPPPVIAAVTVGRVNLTIQDDSLRGIRLTSSKPSSTISGAITMMARDCLVFCATSELDQTEVAVAAATTPRHAHRSAVI